VPVLRSDIDKPRESGQWNITYEEDMAALYLFFTMIELCMQNGATVNMKLLFCADLHASKSHLYSLFAVAEKERVDVIVIGGDIVPKEIYSERLRVGAEYALESQRGYLKKFKKEIKKFAAANPGIKIYLDLGNDDFISNRDVLEVRDGEFYHLLHMRKHALTPDIDIIGYMCIPITPFGIKDWEKPDTGGYPYRFDSSLGGIRLDGVFSKGKEIVYGNVDLSAENSIEADMQKLSAMVTKPFIFVCHCPPWGTKLDMLFDVNLGSRAVRDFIERHCEGDLLVSLHGHIHESQATQAIGRTICVNPGQSVTSFKYHITELGEF
jgi:Icc-related predicted phosphoesterase